jgi:proline iminopeptidase
MGHAQGRTTAAGAIGRAVAISERWTLGGLRQSVVLRGADHANPVLIWVGDLLCEAPVLRQRQAAVEQDFTVVYWRQRHTGSSFEPFAPRPRRLSLDDYVGDLDALTRQVCERLGKAKAVIAAHSSGTIIGLRHVAAHPDLVAAYVGVGQVIDAPENERRAYAWTLETAQARQDVGALRQLGALGPPPYESPRSSGMLRRWVIAYGGAFQGGLSYGRLGWEAALSGYAGWRDLAAAPIGDAHIAPLWADLRAARFDPAATTYKAPIFMASGRYDRRADPPPSGGHSCARSSGELRAQGWCFATPASQPLPG